MGDVGGSCEVFLNATERGTQKGKKDKEQKFRSLAACSVGIRLHQELFYEREIHSIPSISGIPVKQVCPEH